VASASPPNADSAVPFMVQIVRFGGLMQSSSRFLAIEYGVIAIGTVLAIIAFLQLVGTALS
jgi:hypothetical protein